MRIVGTLNEIIPAHVARFDSESDSDDDQHMMMSAG